MTLQELKGYPYVVSAIERYENELAELYEDSAGSVSPDMSGMPHAISSYGSKVENGYIRNEKKIQELKDKLIAYRKRLNNLNIFFNSIEDEQTLQIFELRFKEQMPWEDVASRIGGNNSENSVKKMCYRYLRKNDRF